MLTMSERYIWSSVEDITDHKQAEEELARLYKEMEQLSFQDGCSGQVQPDTFLKEFSNSIGD